jgi:hypothetical protein
MTTIELTSPAALSDPAVEASRVPLAVRVRRWLLVASPVLAGLFAILGAGADPSGGMSGQEMWEIYAAEPGRLQWKSFGFHWSYAFWIAPALLLAPYVRARGAWLATIAAVVAFVGMTTLPGLLIIDFYDSAIGQVAGAGTTEHVNELMRDTMWAARAIAIPGFLGFALALPLAGIAIWRAGLVRWWGPATAVAALAAFLLSGVTWWGAALAAAFLILFAVAVEQATRLPRAA